jgi:hypothetical protein
MPHRAETSGRCIALPAEGRTDAFLQSHHGRQSAHCDMPLSLGKTVRYPGWRCKSRVQSRPARRLDLVSLLLRCLDARQFPAAIQDRVLRPAHAQQRIDWPVQSQRIFLNRINMAIAMITITPSAAK